MLYEIRLAKAQSSMIMLATIPVVCETLHLGSQSGNIARDNTSNGSLANSY